MSKARACDFCGIGGEREVELGALHTLDDVTTHCFCLFFSSGLAQNGEEEEGILGFLIPDILKELARGKKLACAFCSKKGATIGCSERKCRRSYHYACGLKHNVQYRFSGDFRSYCQTHREYQHGEAIGQTVECPICMDELIADPKKAVWSPCCNKKWFHKICVQQLALSAGYFFKCPLCNDRDIFVEDMQNFGIYVPEKDASWELEPNAYSELERPVRCDAVKCLCLDGRKRDDIGTRWEILLCSLCGASGIHIACGKLRFTSTEWTCPTCLEMLEESMKRAQQEVRKRRLTERIKRSEMESSEEENDVKDVASCSTAVKEIVALDFCTPVKSSQLSKPESKNDSISSVCQRDPMETTRISYSTDSEDEIDVELGEYQVPPHTIIRELEENGEELSRKLLNLKNFALRAHERMTELRLTEADIVKMVKETSCHKDFSVDKATVMTFFSSSLPLDKMLQMSKVIRAIYSVREAVIHTAQSSKVKRRRTPGRRQRRMRPCPKTPNIKVTLSKSILSKTLCLCGNDSKICESDCQSVSTMEGDCKISELDMSQVSNKHSRETEAFSSPSRNLWNSSLASPSCELKLNLTMSPEEKTPIYLRNLRSAVSAEVTPPAIRLSNEIGKENDSEEHYNIEENIEKCLLAAKRPLEETAIYHENIMPIESNSHSASTSSQLFQIADGFKPQKTNPTLVQHAREKSCAHTIATSMYKRH
ncbi:pineapple eye protein-like isoform X2 [Palaemon carinicauda]|uniref:pineapple eye protein-like isoform X2 n=1 Tax=Palaemon carinicauda TaxID=392227 RepID=UPI0035B598D4